MTLSEYTFGCLLTIPGAAILVAGLYVGNLPQTAIGGGLLVASIFYHWWVARDYARKHRPPG